MPRLALVTASNGSNAVERLIAALARHGFEAEAIKTGFCDEGDLGPCIPVFAFSGTQEDQGRLIDLVLKFYKNVGIEGKKDRDTRLTVKKYDQFVDREIEFEFGLSFDGAQNLALLPLELFGRTPELGRSIEERYNAKIGRFAEFLEREDSL